MRRSSTQREGEIATRNALGRSRGRIVTQLFGESLVLAAIPAVIAYNRLTHGLHPLEARLGGFADRFHATLSPELEVAT